MKVASRLAGIGPSPIRLVSEGGPADAIPLGLGEPGWSIPEPAREALSRIDGACGYGPNAGLTELRDAIAGYHGASSDEVLVTVGSQGALFALMHAFIEAGDRVLVPDPCFVAYPLLVRLAGGATVSYPLSSDNRFRLDAEAVLEALAEDPGIRAVILNHPSNPTGAGADVGALAAIQDACRERDILLVSDEVYRELYFGARGPSLRDAGDYGLVVSSASKGFGAPGLRVGWIVGDPRWIDTARLIHIHSATATSRVAQAAAVALLRSHESVCAAARDELAVRWRALRGAFEEHLGRAIEPPDGSFYYWLALPERDEVLADPTGFCIRLRDEAHVVVIPGLAFGEAGRPYVRLSFAASPELIREGVRRLAPWWNEA